MCQSRQNHLFTRLLNLTRKKYFIENRVHLYNPSASDHSPPPMFPAYLVEVEHQVQLTDITEESI